MYIKSNTKDYLKEFGNRVKKARLEKGLTMEELAKASGYSSRSSIALIEGGKRDISASKVRAIAYALGVSPLYLSTGEEIKKPVKKEPIHVRQLINKSDNTIEICLKDGRVSKRRLAPTYISQREISDAATVIEQYVTNTKPIELSATEMAIVYELKKMSEEEKELLLKMISKK